MASFSTSMVTLLWQCRPSCCGNFDYLFPVNGGLVTRFRFKEKEFVVYNLIETQFCGKSSFNGKQNFR